MSHSSLGLADILYQKSANLFAFTSTYSLHIVIVRLIFGFRSVEVNFFKIQKMEILVMVTSVVLGAIIALDYCFFMMSIKKERNILNYLLQAILVF